MQNVVLSLWARLLAPIIPPHFGFSHPNARPCTGSTFLNHPNLYNYQKFKLLLTLSRR